MKKAPDRQNKYEIAVFGGGCFWCMEALFQKLKGVIEVLPGYAGGIAEDPSYEDVCSGKTGHAEVIKIKFDPNQISYLDLLNVFFAIHDPTTINRQGADTGTQYRSLVLYANNRQKEIVENFVLDLEKSGLYKDPIVTEIGQLTGFYKAESNHKNYYKTHQNAPYCQVIITPKLTFLREKFSDLVK